MTVLSCLRPLDQYSEYHPLWA